MRRKQGMVRNKTRFLFFPKAISGDWRWMEIASWEEICNYSFEWIASRWLPRTEKENLEHLSNQLDKQEQDYLANGITGSTGMQGITGVTGISGTVGAAGLGNTVQATGIMGAYAMAQMAANNNVLQQLLNSWSKK